MKVAHPHPPIHLLLYGVSGGGKTSLAATFPTPGFVSLFDAHGMDTPFLKSADPKRRKVLPKQIERFKDNDTGLPVCRVWSLKDDLLWEIHYYHDPNPKTPEAWQYFRDDQNRFKPSRWASWVCDSVSSAHEAAKYDQQFRLNPAPKGNQMQWAGGATDELSMYLKNRPASMLCNVVLIAHVQRKEYRMPKFGDTPAQTIKKVSESEATEEDGAPIMVRQIAAPGRLSASEGLMQQYSEVYRCYLDEEGNYRIQTKRWGEWPAKTHIDAPDGAAFTRTTGYKVIWSGSSEDEA